MDITVTDAIDEHTLDAIRQGLRAYNLPPYRRPSPQAAQRLCA